MGIEWFRSWHGAPTDPKWLMIAKRSETQPGVVSAIVWALLDYASQNGDDRGAVEGFDIETYAAFSGFAEETIAAVIACLKDKNIIVDGHLAAWDKRQPKREDNSTERVRAHRNAMKRSETHGNAPDKEKEEDKEEEKDKEEPRVRALSQGWPEDYREQFWTAFPNKVGKPRALQKLDRIARSSVPWPSLLAGLKQYIRTKPPDRPWLNPETFLNQERWADQPAEIVARRRIPDV